MIFQTSFRRMLLASGLMAVSVVYLPSNAVAEPLKIIGPQKNQLNAQTLQYGPTTATDTLWSIALKVRPDKSVNVYQVMAAIYDANRSAFLTNSYGSLEKKMMLTIPSKAEIQAISKRDAQRRAELKTQPKAKPVKAKPVTPEIPVAKVAPAPIEPVTTPVVKTEVIKTEAVKPAVEPMPEVLGDNVVVAEAIDDMTSLQSKLLSLTDTLARAEDQLDANQLDIQELRRQIQQKNELIATLEQSLVDSEQSRLALEEQNRKLDQELSLLKEPIADVEQGNIWQQMMNNPLMLTLAAVLPAVSILLIVGWLLRRRAKNRAESTDNNLDIAAVGSSAVAATAVADVVADEEDTKVVDSSVNADTEVPIDLDTLDDDNIENMLQQNKLIDEPEVTEIEEIDVEAAEPDQQETNNEVDVELDDGEQVTDETLSTTDNDLISTRNDLNDDIDFDEPDLSQSDTEESQIQHASPDLQSLDLVAPDDVDMAPEPEDDFNDILNQLGAEPEIEQQLETASEPEDDFNDILNQLEAEPELTAETDVAEQIIEQAVAETKIEETVAATDIEQDKVTDKIDALSANELVVGAMAQDNDDSDDDFWASLTQDSDDDLEDTSATDKLDDIAPAAEVEDSDEHIWTQFTDSDELNSDAEVNAAEKHAIDALDSPAPSDESNKFDDDLWAQYADGDNQDNDEFDEKQFSLGQGVSVEEALAALDKEEQAAEAAEAPQTPNTFEPETYIDIEKLISDADEDIAEGDPYKEFKIPMDEIDTIMHGTAMVDVDDAENAINAKLDLARAYIEIEDTDSAKALLKEVKLDGNDRQQDEALGLLDKIA